MGLVGLSFGMNNNFVKELNRKTQTWICIAVALAEARS
jgi:hypothetical protein